jgi:Fe-S-cluster-containing hydrogenase component 2
MMTQKEGLMIRNIVQINEDKCIGCGLCAKACKESAIQVIDGKARLIRDDYCDGLGNCLPACPVDAITIVEREAVPFDKSAVEEQKQKSEAPTGGGCPGRQMTRFQPVRESSQPAQSDSASALIQWPVQLKLVPVKAPFFDHAKLLIAADCTAFSYGSFHQDFMRNHVTLIGCPKLDEGSYAEKLTEILKNNAIKSVKVVRMEVPCCGGLENAVIQALKDSGKMIPWQVVVLSTDGKILED